MDENPRKAPPRSPRRRRNLLIAGLAFATVALAAGWYVLSPGIALWGMVRAAKANDIATLASYVDTPALAADMKADISARLNEEAARSPDSTAAMGISLARSMLGAMVGAMTSPEGLRATFAALDESDVPPDARKGGAPSIERLGFNRFRVSREGGRGSGFVFVRHGLGWKLAGVDLPERLPSGAPQRP